jgi:methylmalonyl-CoA epimerase
MAAPIPAVAVDHVGIAVSSADAVPLVRALGTALPAATVMPSGVGVVRFGPGSALELVSPVRPGSPVERFLERRGPGLHHVALEVAGPLAGLFDGLRSAGLEVIGDIEPSADGRLCLFLHPSSTGGVLVELVEGARAR